MIGVLLLQLNIGGTFIEKEVWVHFLMYLFLCFITFSLFVFYNLINILLSNLDFI